MHEENEENMEWLLKNIGENISFDKINLNLQGMGVMYRYEDLGKYKDCMLLVFPSGLYEGFFVCKIRKRNI